MINGISLEKDANNRFCVCFESYFHLTIFFAYPNEIKLKLEIPQEITHVENISENNVFITSKRSATASSMKSIYKKVSLRGGELIDREDRDLQIIPAILSLGAFLPAFIVAMNDTFLTFWQWFYLDGPGILNPFSLLQNQP